MADDRKGAPKTAPLPKTEPEDAEKRHNRESAKSEQSEKRRDTAQVFTDWAQI